VLLKCGHLAFRWDEVKHLVEGKLIKDAWCDRCETWQKVLRKPHLMEILGLGTPPELPLDPPF